MNLYPPIIMNHIWWVSLLSGYFAPTEPSPFVQILATCLATVTASFALKKSRDSRRRKLSNRGNGLGYKRANSCPPTKIWNIHNNERNNWSRYSYSVCFIRASKGEKCPHTKRGKLPVCNDFPTSAFLWQVVILLCLAALTLADDDYEVSYGPRFSYYPPRPRIKLPFPKPRHVIPYPKPKRDYYAPGSVEYHYNIDYPKWWASQVSGGMVIRMWWSSFVLLLGVTAHVLIAFLCR